MNFAAYAVLQVAVVVVLRRLAGGPAALLGLGMTWALRTVYLQAGGIVDFRADFAALCLFSVTLGLALAGRAFESLPWSLLAGCAAAACVWARFLTIVYLAAILAAFAAVMLVRRARAVEVAELRSAGARCRGAALCGVVMAALSAPALWAQRAGIDEHYFRGILGPMRAVRAQVVGADRTLGNLVFYPQSLLDHAGPIVSALAVGLAALLVLEWTRRRATWSATASASAWLLAIAFLVPLALLTLLTSKSSVVGGILTGPLLWAIPLGATAWCVRTPRVGPWSRPWLGHPHPGRVGGRRRAVPGMAQAPTPRSGGSGRRLRAVRRAGAGEPGARPGGAGPVRGSRLGCPQCVDREREHVRAQRQAPARASWARLQHRRHRGG